MKMEKPNTIEAIEKNFIPEEMKIIGTIFSSYILATDGKLFFMIDQHAAHERIYYEQLLRQYQCENPLTQHLLLPLVISASYTERETIENWFQFLHKIGYVGEEFGVNTYRFTGIPGFMNTGEAEDFLKFFIENIQEGTPFENKIHMEKIIARACKGAVKAGDSLKDQEIRELIHQLFLCENPYSCPHGRPTLIKLSKYEIERMFKRV